MAMPEYTDGVLELYEITMMSQKTIRRRDLSTPDYVFGIVSLQCTTRQEPNCQQTALR